MDTSQGTEIARKSPVKSDETVNAWNTVLNGGLTSCDPAKVAAEAILNGLSDFSPARNIRTTLGRGDSLPEDSLEVTRRGGYDVAR